MFTKSKKQTQNQLLKQTPLFQECFIIQKIASIDGHQTIKKYKKSDLLGKGGFANCFVTQNVQTKKKAATKIIQKQLLTSQKTKLRLLNEIRLHKMLHHQNIVEFQHYFEDKNNVYIFLQLCQNQSLNEIIKIRQYFSTSQIQFFMYGIINGLQYLHSKSIIHRDLKLGNIFLDSKFNIKLGDFGLATKLEFKKQCKRTICGTPNYIAPQILEGKGYHFQVDIWSIGVILYTLYFTIPPFQTEQASTTYQKIKKVEYSFPKYMIVPQQAIDLIKRILVKNPANRPSLEDILNSDFMKLGNRIYKELPQICARKLPMKKDLVGLPFYTHQQLVRMFTKSALLESNRQLKAKNMKNTSNNKINQENIIYVKDFQNLGNNQQGKYFYELSDGTVSIFTGDEIVFKDQFGMIKSLNLKNKQNCIKIDKEHPLKSLLNCKTKLKQVNKNIKIPKISLQQPQTFILQSTTNYQNNMIPIHIKKISQQKKHNFYMLRLSNQTIQLIFADGIDYLILNKGQLIKQIKNGKINNDKKINIESFDKIIDKKDQNNVIENRKLKYIKGILATIKNIKQKITMKDDEQKFENVQDKKQKQNNYVTTKQLFEATNINHKLNNPNHTHKVNNFSFDQNNLLKNYKSQKVFHNMSNNLISREQFKQNQNTYEKQEPFKLIQNFN